MKRKTYTPEQRRSLVALWKAHREAGGRTKDFAAREGVGVLLLYQWARRIALGAGWAAPEATKQEPQTKGQRRGVGRGRGRPNIFERLKMRLELDQGKWCGYCKWCDWTTQNIARRDTICYMARHIRLKHHQVPDPGRYQHRSKQQPDAMIVRDPVQISTRPIQAARPSSPDYFDTFYCPNCGLSQDAISKAYQVVGIASQLGYRAPNGKPPCGGIRYCVRCGFDLLPGMKSLAAFTAHP